MSTNNFYPFIWVKKILGDNLFVRATKHEKNGYCYVVGTNVDDTIGILCDCRHQIINLEKHNNANPTLFKSLQVHRKRGGRIDWSLAFKDNLF